MSKFHWEVLTTETDVRRHHDVYLVWLAEGNYQKRTNPPSNNSKHLSLYVLWRSISLTLFTNRCLGHLTRVWRWPVSPFLWLVTLNIDHDLWLAVCFDHRHSQRHAVASENHRFHGSIMSEQLYPTWIIYATAVDTNSRCYILASHESLCVQAIIFLMILLSKKGSEAGLRLSVTSLKWKPDYRVFSRSTWAHGVKMLHDEDAFPTNTILCAHIMCTCGFYVHGFTPVSEQANHLSTDGSLAELKPDNPHTMLKLQSWPQLNHNVSLKV